MLLTKFNKLNTVEVLLYKSLIDSYINFEKIASVNSMGREYNKVKEKSKILKTMWNILYKDNRNVLCQL